MMRTTRHWTAVLSVWGLISVGWGVVAPAASADLVACSPGSRVIGDVDSDGTADTVTGVPPVELPGSGAVDVRGSRGWTQVVTGQDLGFGTEHQFGASVAVHDMNADGCDDLVVGAPPPRSYPPAASGDGRVVVLFGRTDGVSVADARVIAPPAPAGGIAVGSFGAQVRVVAPEAGPTPGHPAQIIVSAPFTEVAGRPAAGAVLVYEWAHDGTLSAPAIVTQNTPGVAGGAESQDYFGSALAADGRTIVVGATGEDVGTVRDAGTITLLTSVAAAPRTFRGVSISQNTTGVPGSAERGDAFGSSVALLGRRLVVGVPGEDIGTARDTGLIQPFLWTEATRRLRSQPSISQNTAGVPGGNETLDRFGSALAIGRGVMSAGRPTILVGYPEDTIFEGFPDDGTFGALTLMELTSTGTVRQATVLRLGRGLPGTAQRADLGSRVAILRGDESLGAYAADGYLVGAPYYDVPVLDTRGGRVARVQGGQASLLAFSLGADQAELYGRVLAVPGGLQP